MHIDEKAVRKNAHLARLQLEPEEIREMQVTLSRILDWVEQLNEVDTQNVEPLFNVTLEHMPMRKDEITEGGYVQEILANAPEAALDMFAVNKVVE